jgi:hypothetical protein
MGEQKVKNQFDAEQLRLFSRKLLTDLRALETMLENGLFETKVRRIGAEQEMFLVDRDWRPAPVATELLERIDDPHFTTELGRFNMECNLDPITLGGTSLREMERQLTVLLHMARLAAEELDTEVVLCGILPTLDKADLSLDNMTPRARYFALNEAMTRLRGGRYHLHLKGRDEINVTHDNVMLESCNTSFRFTFRSSPRTSPVSTTPLKQWPHQCWRRPRTPPCFSAGNSGGRPASRSFSSPSIPVRQPDISGCRAPE